jgi:hypothetical protein
MTADVFISPEPAIAAGRGLCVVHGGQTEEVCECHQGDWVKKALFAITSAGTATLYIIEGFDN